MLKLATATIVALLCAVPAAHAVTVRATPEPGGGTVVTITGSQLDERVVVRPGPVNATAPDDDLELELDVPRLNLTQSGCREVNVLANFRKLRCRTGASGRLTAQLGGGDDILTIERVDRALGRQGPRLVEVDGGDGDDRVTVPAGLAAPNPFLTGAVAPVLLRGGTGFDRLTSGSPSDLLGEQGPDRLAGGDGDDSLDGDLGEDVLLGGEGGDDLIGGPGGDDVDGGPGPDAHSYAGSPPVSVTLDDACDDGAAQDTREPTFIQAGLPGECQNNGVDRDRLLRIESVTGTSGSDTLVGGASAERLAGEGGDDTIDGGGGPDRLIGGQGVDLLLARDGIVDSRIICGDEFAIPVVGPGGGQSAPPATPRDRAVVDANDVVSTTCDIVERGGATGPSEDTVDRPGSPQEPGGPPPPATGTSGAAEPGAGPGGARAGLAPQLRILSRAATPDRRGRVALRLACVYLARECASTLTLTAPRALRVVERRGGRRRVLRLRRGAVLGRARTSIPWGRSARVRVRLAPAFRAFLRASGRRRVTTRLSVVARDSAQRGSARARLSARLLVGRRSR